MVEEGVVIGGGCVYLCMQDLDGVKVKATDQAGVEIVKVSASPIRQITVNAGVDGFSSWKTFRG